MCQKSNINAKKYKSSMKTKQNGYYSRYIKHLREHNIKVTTIYKTQLYIKV